MSKIYAVTVTTHHRADSKADALKKANVTLKRYGSAGSDFEPYGGGRVDIY